MTGYPQNQSFCRRIVVVSKSVEIETYQSNIAFVPELVFEKCWERIRFFHQGNQVVVLPALYVICMPLRFWYVSAVPTLLKNTKNLQHQLCWFWISRWGRQGGCDDAARRSDLVRRSCIAVSKWRVWRIPIWSKLNEGVEKLTFGKMGVLFTALACYLAIKFGMDLIRSA